MVPRELREALVHAQDECERLRFDLHVAQLQLAAARRTLGRVSSALNRAIFTGFAARSRHESNPARLIT